MQGNDGVSTRSPQQVPFLGHINVHLGLRPECLDSGVTAATFQTDFALLQVRVYAAAAAEAFNIACDKTGARSTFSDEPKSVVIS